MRCDSALLMRTKQWVLPLSTASHCERLAGACLAIRKYCAIDAVKCRQNN